MSQAVRIPVCQRADRAQEFRDDAEPVLPSGWWLLPAVVIGSGMWVGLAILIF